MPNQQFKKQLFLLKEKGNFITISDFENHTKEILKSTENLYLITFDDGLKEQYTQGYSILNELYLEAYFFLKQCQF